MVFSVKQIVQSKMHKYRYAFFKGITIFCAIKMPDKSENNVLHCFQDVVDTIENLPFIFLHVDFC